MKRNMTLICICFIEKKDGRGKNNAHSKKCWETSSVISNTEVGWLGPHSSCDDVFKELRLLLLEMQTE